MSLMALRKQFLVFFVLLVPIINFIFLALFVFSPSSVPRLPRAFAPFSKSGTTVVPEESESFEHINFAQTFNRYSRPVAGENNNVGREGSGRGLGATLEQASDNTSGINYLLEQRQLLEGVKLTPLPDHLISTYRPGYYETSPFFDPSAHDHSEEDASVSSDGVQDRAIERDPSTKYLTFLPHSGFHNQRTELENALLLARLLNRTLIMPKVYLGPPMPWLTFRRLHERLLYQTKIGLEHCRAIIENQEEEEDEEQEEERAIDVEEMAKEKPLHHQDQLQNLAGGEKQSQNQQQQQHHHHHHYQQQQQQQLLSENEAQLHSDTSAPRPDPESIIDDNLVSENHEEGVGALPESENSNNDDWHKKPDGEVDTDDGGEREEGEDEEDEEEEGSSWIEEPESEEGRVSIATGDGVDGLLDLEDVSEDEDEQDEYTDGAKGDVRDWEAVEDEEDEEYTGMGIQTGIVGEPNVESDALLPLHMPPLDTNVHRGRSRIRKRSLEQGYPSRRDRIRKGQAQHQHAKHPAPSQNTHLHYSQQSPQQQQTVRRQRRVKWTPLPAECLQYESWTMADWDLFFDLNPLRRYVRILTRESMSIAYLIDRFNLTMPKEEEELKVNESIDENAQKSSGGSEGQEDDKDGDDDSSSDGGNLDVVDSSEEEESEKEVPLLRSEGDILFFDDTNLYDYRFSENPDAEESLRTKPKFGQEFTVEWLASRPERLIHLGSIFGSGRVSIDSLDSRAWLQTIRDHLILGSDILQTTSQRIVDKINDNAADFSQSLSGETRPDPLDAGLVGVHIRMSDGHFSLTARDTIENIRQELMWQMGITDDANDNGEQGVPMHPIQGRMSIEQCRSRARNHRQALREQLEQQKQQQEQRQQQGQQQQQQQQSFSQAAESTRPRRRSNGRFTPIYLATDAHRPRANPIFDKLFETFSCIFTLDDFADELEPLHQFRNPEDGALMAKFLIPMIDAMVVAKSAAFFGTPSSTFSNYIQRQLRPAYTGLYD
ncbi:hypothetical protein BGZ98_007507 [Dissophora globulifera]|nr:hypothetical protein BGZ98_007507 [Dissophora globulifera]